jgi:hypothetical protein
VSRALCLLVLSYCIAHFDTLHSFYYIIRVTIPDLKGGHPYLLVSWPACNSLIKYFGVSDWISEEFKDLSLGDKRLEQRFKKTMSAFHLKPDGCINRIFKDEKAARKAAYRMFDNWKVTSAKVLDCHREMTTERMKEHKIVLSLHDSSFFSYNTKPSIEGLGNIGGSLGNGEETKGFIGHYALGITEEGLPLGLQAVKTWSRAYESEWEKESERWVELMEEAETTYSENTQMVFIADREAD